ncbi:hypothetical protein Bra1253DRAFT_00120 [Bradyrhizobium sp. WSM1253]|nr:hypothetical protein Bra1253DRAFT_00120 [Bradyrhizobium sp. WSM1253]
MQLRRLSKSSAPGPELKTRHASRRVAWSGDGWLPDGAFYPFRERAPRPRWDMWRHATPAPDLHKVHKAQRTKLKPQEPTRKMLSDQKPVQPLGARTSLGAHRAGNDDATAASPPVNRAPDDVQVTPPSVEGKDVQAIGTAPVDAAADIVQVTPPPVIERKGEQTIGTALEDVLADVVQVTPPRIIEHNKTSITRSLDGSLVMMMVLVALGFMMSLPFRRRHAERVLAFAAMRSESGPCSPSQLTVSTANRIRSEFLIESGSVREKRPQHNQGDRSRDDFLTAAPKARVKPS